MLHKQISWPVCIRKRTMVGYEGINEKKIRMWILERTPIAQKETEASQNIIGFPLHVSQLR